ncbi:hypothetical protein [Streptomyces sp. NPDC054797]
MAGYVGVSIKTIRVYHDKGLLSEPDHASGFGDTGRRTPSAVAVFVSFLVGLLAMTRFARTERKTALAWVNGLAAAAVAFTLLVNLLRGWPVLSLAATLLIAGALYVRWARAGRPSGIEDVEARAEAD